MSYGDRALVSVVGSLQLLTDQERIIIIELSIREDLCRWSVHSHHESEVWWLAMYQKELCAFRVVVGCLKRVGSAGGEVPEVAIVDRSNVVAAVTVNRSDLSRTLKTDRR